MSSAQRVWLITGELGGFPSSIVKWMDAVTLPLSLTSKIGCSAGFGRRLVYSALARGDKVIATARSLGKIEDLSENALVKDKAENLRLLALDVTAGFAAIKEVIDKANTFWGRIDVLVNNAGYGVPAILEEGG